MSTDNRWAALAAPCLVWLSLAAGPEAAAQAYPNRVIRMVVPFAAGGGTDTTARIVSHKLAEQQVGQGGQGIGRAA